MNKLLLSILPLGFCILPLEAHTSTQDFVKKYSRHVHPADLSPVAAMVRYHKQALNQQTPPQATQAQTASDGTEQKSNELIKQLTARITEIDTDSQATATQKADQIIAATTAHVAKLIALRSFVLAKHTLGTAFSLGATVLIGYLSFRMNQAGMEVKPFENLY